MGVVEWVKHGGVVLEKKWRCAGDNGCGVGSDHINR